MFKFVLSLSFLLSISTKTQNSLNNNCSNKYPHITLKYIKILFIKDITRAKWVQTPSHYFKMYNIFYFPKYKIQAMGTSEWFRGVGNGDGAQI